MSDLRMPDINKVTIAGRLTRDSELRYLQQGTPVCSFSLAVSKKYKTKAGETREDSLFVDVTVWGSAGEWVAENVKKGHPVLVEGELKRREWQDKATGEQRSKLDITAKRVQSLIWEDRGQQKPPSGGRDYGGYKDAPAPRDIQEPLPDDDIPF